MLHLSSQLFSRHPFCLSLRLFTAGIAMAVLLGGSALMGCGKDDKNSNNSKKPKDGLARNDIIVMVGPTSVVLDPHDGPPVAGISPEELPSDAALTDVGLVAVGGGETGEITINLPDDTYAMTIYAYSHDRTDPSEVIITSAYDPTGLQLINNNSGNFSGQMGAFDAQFNSINRVVSSQVTGAFLIPNTPNYNFVGGEYRIKLGNYVVQQNNGGGGFGGGQPSFTLTSIDRPLHVYIVTRHAKIKPTTGVLDLTLNFTGANGITAANAPDNVTIQTALTTMRSSYGAVGITIGDVEYRDIGDPSLQTIVLGENGCNGGDLDTLLRHSGDGNSNRLNLFFIGHFQCIIGGFFDMGQGIGGISGGIPGIPLVVGSRHSGVAIATDMFMDDAAQMATVMSHETGHFLGLYHTQKNNQMGGPSIYDIIDDTPNTANGAKNNLMYFSAGTSQDLSAGQGYVMHNNPWVKR